MAENGDIHKGHRKRMMEKFSEFGIDVFSDHEKLEMLLYLMLPRKNTNLIAHNLINGFGSLKNLLIAPGDELQKIEGIGKSSSLNLQFIGAFTNYLNRVEATPKESFAVKEKVTEFCINYFKDKIKEVLTLILLDDKYTLLQVCDINSDELNHVTFGLREIVGLIMKYNCRNVIIAHNHIKGTANPSDDDVRQTREINRYLKAIDVGLVDHIIVSKDNAISLRNQGIMNDVWEL